MGHSEKSAAMIQQTRSDPQNGKHSQTKEMMHMRAERKGRLMRNSKRSTLIGMCINVVFCAALLAGCGGGGSSSAGPADSNEAKQTVHEETVIHALGHSWSTEYTVDKEQPALRRVSSRSTAQYVTPAMRPLFMRFRRKNILTASGK